MTEDKPIKVLVVDDEKPSTMLFSEILKDQGYDYRCMNAPEAAVIVAKEFKPDIVVSDVSMPDMDGFRFQEIIRRVNDDRDIGFIYVSAFSRSEDKVRGLQSGADDYITKPFDIGEFVVRLRRVADHVLNRRKLLKDDQSLKGSLEEIGLTELIQILNASKRNGILHLDVHAGNGAVLSEVGIQNGEIIHAHSHPLEGEAAFCLLLSFKKGKFSFESRKDAATLPEKTIHKRTSQLLLDGTKFIDDYNSIIKSKPVVKIQSSQGLSDIEQSILASCHTRETVDEMILKHHFHPFMAVYTVKVLGEKGYLDLGFEDTDVIQLDKLFSGITEDKVKEEKYSVLVVDDSHIIRKAIVKMLKADPMFTSVIEASNGREAIDKVNELNPDIVTLDINMPIMDGLSALKHIMVMHPRPVVMISTLTRDGAETSFEALKLGALDVICKPTNSDPSSFEQQKQELVEKVKRAVKVKKEGLKRIRSIPARRKYQNKSITDRIVIVGAEKGAYSSVIKIVSNLPGNLDSAVVIVQYMPEEYVQPLADFLSSVSEIAVKRFDKNTVLETGTCYISGDNQYLSLVRGEQKPMVEVSLKNFQFDHQRSIDMCMFAMSERFGNRTMGVILSGEVDDGVEGMREIQRLGGQLLVNEPSYSLYPAMAENIIKAGLVQVTYSIEKIVDKIIKHE